MSHTKKRMSFVAFPKFLVVWPLIMAGFFLPMLQELIPTVFTNQRICEVWIVTLIFVLVTLGFDFDNLWTAIIVLLLSLGIVASLLIATKYNIPILERLRLIVQSLRLEITSDNMLSISFILGVIYIFMLITCCLNHSWVVTEGKIERTKFLLRSSEELPISQSRSVNHEIKDAAGIAQITVGASTDGAARVINLSQQRIRSNVNRVHVDRGVPTNHSATAVIDQKVRVARSCEIASESEVIVRAPDRRIPADCSAAI